MKIFISWSGDLSQAVATILHKYIPCMIQGVEVFMSKHDIESGIRWAETLSIELEQTNFGIICLTPENLHNDWILFEAGANAKHIEGRACGLLLGGLRPSDVVGPLAQFQHRVFQESDFKTLMSDVNAKEQQPLSADQLKLVFDKWWPDISAEYKNAVSKVGRIDVELPRRLERDIIEEVLSLVRAIADTVLATEPTETIITISDSDIAKLLIDTLPKRQLEVLKSIGRLKYEGKDAEAQQYAKAHLKDIDMLIKRNLAMRSPEGWVGIPDIYKKALLSRIYE